jgi:DNA-binding NtrC family response regulator
MWQATDLSCSTEQLTPAEENAGKRGRCAARNDLGRRGRSPNLRARKNVPAERWIKVVTADEGEEGLRVYKSHQSSIALLPTNLMMPKMNRVDLADRVLQLDSHLPVLLMSGDAPRANLRFGCLEKPFNCVDLVGGVAQVLHSSGEGRENERLR